MEITIRKITPEDVPVLAQMAQQTFYDTFTGTCTEEDMQGFLKEYFNEEQLGKEVANENDLYFFALADGIPAGYIRFMEDYSGLSLMKQWKALELKRIYVLKEFHGKGIAQALIDFFLDYARQQQYQVVWLGVWEHNYRAQKFYEKYGFVNSGHTHDFPIGNTPQTDYWFWKFL
ncbi:MAG: GNAT family N-acetyltransferase [Bacteroidetes bacterium]|nr:GNAT family N-acetyltransferase [Bacteroidota bacterium]